MKLRVGLLIVAAFLVLGAGMTVALLMTSKLAKPEPPMPVAPEPQTAPAPAPLKQAEWNTYHGNSGLLGFSETTLPEDLNILWRFKAGAPVNETPVAQGQNIFFATAKGEIVAVDMSGQRVWMKEFFTGEKVNNEPVRERIDSPIAVFEKLVLFGTSDGHFIALDAESGGEKWRVRLVGPIRGSANYLAGKPGRAYVLEQSTGSLICVDSSNGNIFWRSEGVERCDGSPSVSKEAVTFGSCAAAIHVVSPETGALARNIKIDGDSQIAGGVAQDNGMAFSGCRSGKALQVEVSTGKIVWTNEQSESEVFSTPAVSDKWVVTASNDGSIYGIDRADGKGKWKFDTKGSPTSAVIAGDKVLFGADGELFLLRLADGTKIWSLKISDEITAPAVAGDMILVGSGDGTVVALGAPKKQEPGTP